MNKADRVKLIYFFSISLLIFLYGCIDTNVQVIPSSFDFRSQLKVVNLASKSGTGSFILLDKSKKTAGVSLLSSGVMDADNAQNMQGDLKKTNGIKKIFDIPNYACIKHRHSFCFVRCIF